jgi:hypothetical protein
MLQGEGRVRHLQHAPFTYCNVPQYTTLAVPLRTDAVPYRVQQQQQGAGWELANKEEWNNKAKTENAKRKQACEAAGQRWPPNSKKSKKVLPYLV